jgi:hypothetical protein
MARAAAKKAANGAKRGPGRPRKESSESTAPASREAAPPKPNRPDANETAERLAKLTRLKTEARRIAGDISALASEAKKAGGPAYWKSLVRVHDLQKLDPDEARAELEMLVDVAAQVDIKITWMGDQAAFADVMDMAQPAKNTQGTRDLAAARAHADGFNSGKNGGVPHDNPFNPGTEEYVSWHDGRDEGQRSAEAKNPRRAARVKEAATADASLPDEGLEGTF